MVPGEGGISDMEKRMFKVEERFCDECALALRRFIGHMDGVESIDVEKKMIAVVFDPLKMPEEKLNEIAADSLEKLGYKLIV
jgi:copper chaperone CopZ